MTRHPIDLPDEPRPSIPDAYRVYPADLNPPHEPLAGWACSVFLVMGLVGWLLFVIALVALGFVVWLA